MGVVHAVARRATSRRRRTCAARSTIVCASPPPRSAISPIDWGALAADYDGVRDHIAASIPGFDDFNERVRRPGGFVLPNPPRDTRRSRRRPAGRGSRSTAFEPIVVPPGRLLLQTVRSHDQYNTTIYGLDDRYRGIRGGRRVVFVNPATSTRSGSPTATSSTSSASGADGSGAPRPWLPRRRLPDARRGPAPPTSPRPTSSCRSTASPRAAARRRRSRSSSASSAVTAIDSGTSSANSTDLLRLSTSRRPAFRIRSLGPPRSPTRRSVTAVILAERGDEPGRASSVARSTASAYRPGRARRPRIDLRRRHRRRAPGRSGGRAGRRATPAPSRTGRRRRSGSTPERRTPTGTTSSRPSGSPTP